MRSSHTSRFVLIRDIDASRHRSGLTVEIVDSHDVDVLRGRIIGFAGGIPVIYEPAHARSQSHDVLARVLPILVSMLNVPAMSVRYATTNEYAPRRMRRRRPHSGRELL